MPCWKKWIGWGFWGRAKCACKVVYCFSTFYPSICSLLHLLDHYAYRGRNLICSTVLVFAPLHLLRRWWRAAVDEDGMETSNNSSVNGLYPNRTSIFYKPLVCKRPRRSIVTIIHHSICIKNIIILKSKNACFNILYWN